MKKTIKGIVGLGINPKFFQSQPHCLWQEQSHLYNNLILLIEYNLTKNLKNCKNFEFLLEEKLEEKIDLLIELGYYEYLENGIEILNYPRETLKRLELLKQMNIPLDDIEILEDVLENPKFIVKDSDLDQYIMDYAAYDDENSVSIESFNMNDIDKISISIGDSIFSMPKIKRNLYEGKTLLKAMFYRKRVTEEEYKQVINILTNHTNYSI